MLRGAMSQENIEAVRRVYEGWAQGDFSENDAFDPEVEFAMVDWPEGSNAHGRDAMWRSWRSALSAWEDFRAEPIEFIDAGEDSVVVLNRIEGRGKGSGARVQADTATVWALEAGKVVGLALYWDIAKALEAAATWSHHWSKLISEAAEGALTFSLPSNYGRHRFERTRGECPIGRFGFDPQGRPAHHPDRATRRVARGASTRGARHRDRQQPG
jgi:ketosteroid isomerase-like protein